MHCCFFFFMNPRSHQRQGEFADSRTQVSRHVRYHLYIIFKPVECRLFLQISHLRRGEDRTHIRWWAATVEPAWNMAAQCASEHQATTMISLWPSWIKHDTLVIRTGTDNKRRPFVWGVLRHKCGFACLADEADTSIFPNVNRQELAKMRS